MVESRHTPVYVSVCPVGPIAEADIIEWARWTGRDGPGAMDPEGGDSDGGIGASSSTRRHGGMELDAFESRRRAGWASEFEAAKDETMAGRLAASWSLTVGRLMGVPLRIHFLFLLFALLTLTYTVDDMLSEGLLTLGVLLVSLMLHESAHAYLARKLGGEVDQIVLGPLGGLSFPRVPEEPNAQVCVALAGPLVHLILAFFAALVLVVGVGFPVSGLLSPFNPLELVDGSLPIVALKLTTWINWMLFLTNLLPAYPFDGAGAVRALLWPMLGRRSACVVTSQIAMIVAIGMLAAGFALQSRVPHPTIPLWMPMLTLATFLFFSARHDLAMAERMPASKHRAGIDGEKLELLKDLFDAQEEDGLSGVLVEHGQDASRYMNVEADDGHPDADDDFDDDRVDDVLARLQEVSLEGLSKDELVLLQKASVRYRQKHGRQSRDES